MGIFSKRKTDVEPFVFPVIPDMETLSFQLETASLCLGNLSKKIVSNAPLLAYVTKTLAPKLVRPAMVQNFAECFSIMSADPVIGPLVGKARDFFERGYNE